MVDAAGQFGAHRDSFRHPADHFRGLSRAQEFRYRHGAEAQVLPPSLKEFEGALRGVGIDPDKDVEQLTFASYRSGKQGVKVVGVAQGQFAMAAVLKKMRLSKVKPIKLRNADIYPMPAGMQMTFLDDSTLLFGDSGALRGALDARDGYYLHPGQQHPDRGHDGLG